MNRLLLYLVIWAALVLTATADFVAHYPRLPAKVATHFNAAGAPDGWSSRQGLAWTWVFSVGVVPVIILGSAAAAKYLPARFINVPHRDYWLAPERIDSTRAVVCEMVHRIGIALFLFMASLNHLILRANLSPKPDVGVWPWILTGALFVATAGLILPTTLRFRRRH